MTLVHIIGLGVNASLFLVVFALGLRASVGDLSYLVRNPRLLLRSMISMNVVMVAFAIIVAMMFNLHPAVKIALVALACSPVPPFLPIKQTKAGGTEEYSIGLLATMAAAAIIIVPLAIELVGVISGRNIHMPIGRVAFVVFTSVLIPLILGIVVRAFWPERSDRLAHMAGLIGGGVLLVFLLPILVKSFPTFLALIGNGVVLALVLFAVVGLVVGHFLGGPEPANRTVLALATATRHPGVAMAIAAITFPDQKAVTVVVIWHLILGTLASAPYVRWWKRVQGSAQSPASAPRSMFSHLLHG